MILRANPFVFLALLNSIPMLSAMGVPTMTGTTKCDPMPSSKFEVFSSSGSNFASHNHLFNSITELFPVDTYRAVVVGFYYAD